jgi:Kef-type K+ transport system membrane component KefB/nucleotide-binding universal stress UspA family protein
MLFWCAAQPLSHEATLLFLGQLTLLLGVARLLGELMRRLDQPAVIGELLAGLLVGPSVLGWISPTWQSAIFPPTQQSNDLLSAFSLVGVLMLLIVTGLEIDLNLIVRRLRTAAWVSLGGLLVPLALGLWMGFSLPDTYLVKPNQRLVFALFIAVIMSISAIPVIAKVLMDLKAIRRDIGQIIMAAAMVDDAIGWVLLSVAAGLVSKGHVTFQDVGYSLGTSIAVMGLGLWLGRAWVNRALNFLENVASGEAPQLTGILFLSLAFSVLTHGLGLESMLGAFLAGILVGQSPRLRSQVAHTLELFTASFFAPIFFACAGLKVNLAALFSVQQMLLLLAVLTIASLGKYLGCYLGGLMGGLTHWERLCAGSGMNPRGAMGVIVARIGLSLGVINDDMYSVCISMAILTSLAAPPLLRWSLSRVPISPEESLRMGATSHQAESFLHSMRKVLLPSRGGSNAEWAAHLLGHFSHHHPVAITALFALPNAGEKPPQAAIAALSAQLQRSQGPAPKIKTVHGQAVSEAILGEASKGNYDLLVLGATSTSAEGTFNLLIDEVMSGTPCPTMVVRAHPNFEEGLQVNVRRVLLPAVGTHYSLRAAELAAVICRSLQASLTILHVVPSVDGEALGPRSQELSQTFGQHVVDDHADIARSLGAQVDTVVLDHVAPERAIVEYANSEGYDLIFMGLNFRPVGGRVFLGHRAERVMRSANAAVVALSSG